MKDAHTEIISARVVVSQCATENLHLARRLWKANVLVGIVSSQYSTSNLDFGV